MWSDCVQSKSRGINRKVSTRAHRVNEFCKTEHRRSDAFKSWCWAWTARSNQTILKEIILSNWKDCCWSWNSNTLATGCEELTHWKRPWCWERLKAGGEGDDRGWDGWMASLTQWSQMSRLWETVEGREAWRAAVHGVTKSRTQVSDWTVTTRILRSTDKY